MAAAEAAPARPPFRVRAAAPFDSAAARVRDERSFRAMMNRRAEPRG